MNKRRERRVRRTRAKIVGSALRPRLAVARSNRFIYAQLIDDEKSHTLVAASSRELARGGKKIKKSEAAEAVGKLIAQRAQEKGIGQAVFDRRSYAYHGRIKVLVESARNSGFKI